MSIQSEITLLQNTKDGLRTAIMEKGVVVGANELFSNYPTRISQISTQSGTFDESLKKLLDGSYTSYSIPEGTSMLRQNAFNSYTSLTSITIPTTITFIGDHAFYNCTSLNRVNISDLSAWCKIVFSYDYEYSSNPLSLAHKLYLNGTLITELVIPSSITVVNDLAFYSNTSLTSVVIPDSVELIGGLAFSNCNNIITVEIGEGVTHIGSNAFAWCSKLTSITIKATTPPYVDNNTFSQTNNCPIYVPADSLQDYLDDPNWSIYSSRLQAIPEPVVVPKFVRIAETTDATDGKYLIVDMTSSMALNASLITSTTNALNGINKYSSGNTISVTIEPDGTITANAENLNAAAYYDATNQKLYWENSNNVKYYLSQYRTTSTNFKYTSPTTVPTTTITPYKGNANYITLKQSYCLGGDGNNTVSWYDSNNATEIGRVALFKYVEE